MFFMPRPLTQLFASAGHVRVLRALLMYGAPLSVAQLAADSGLTMRGTRFVLESLVSQGMVGVFGQPRSQLYYVVPQHPLVDAVTVLFQQERSRWEGVQEAFRQALASRREIGIADLEAPAGRIGIDIETAPADQRATLAILHNPRCVSVRRSHRFIPGQTLRKGAGRRGCVGVLHCLRIAHEREQCRNVGLNEGAQGDVRGEDQGTASTEDQVPLFSLRWSI